MRRLSRDTPVLKVEHLTRYKAKFKTCQLRSEVNNVPEKNKKRKIKPNLKETLNLRKNLKLRIQKTVSF